MLKISEKPLHTTAQKTLDELQSSIDAIGIYSQMVSESKLAWEAKRSTKEKLDAFREIRKTLAIMCIGSIRCAYCEDSLADEVEHIRPKNFFPELTFKWTNYLFACGPCNGPKGNRYGVLNGNAVDEFLRNRSDPITPPPVGRSALIDPRTEEPLEFLELDLGGTSPDGEEILGTFMFLPRDVANAEAQARAAFSIDVLGLNREAIRFARENAFGGFRARLREYVAEKNRMVPPARLDALRDDMLSTPHLTVFAEMRRQKDFLPNIRALFVAAPEAEAWPLVPPTA
jgi:uncharacterized protein (TIGR02646 family)